MTGGDDGTLPTDGDFGRLHGLSLHEPAIAHLMNQLWRDHATGGLQGRLFAEGVILQIAALLLRLRDGQAEISRGALPPWQVKRVTEYLASHLAQDVTLAELASLVGLSQYHFCRAFKQSTGLPPHRWLQARRMERAQELLLQSNRPITDVAAAVGYEAPSQFALVFRRATGLSPSRYCKERQR